VDTPTQLPLATAKVYYVILALRERNFYGCPAVNSADSKVSQFLNYLLTRVPRIKSDAIAVTLLNAPAGYCDGREIGGV